MHQNLTGIHSHYSSSASALVPVTGSYDYLTSYKGRGRPSKDRRKKSASNASRDPAGAGSSVRRTQSAFETHQQQIRFCGNSRRGKYFAERGRLCLGHFRGALGHNSNFLVE